MKNDLTIVTGASSNHFGCLQNLLWSVSKFEPDARVIAYDLGLTDEQNATLQDVPPFYLENWELRKFDFTKYPPHFSMSADAGRMAFRPTTVAAVAHEFGGTVMWMDAGCQVRERLDAHRACLKQQGVYCACAPGNIQTCLHLAARAPLAVTDDLLPMPIRDAGVCGFDTTSPPVMALIDRWAAVALDPACTAPSGSTRYTHRQDAVFAVILNQAAKANDWKLDGKNLRGLAIKQDRLTLKETKFRVGEN